MYELTKAFNYTIAILLTLFYLYQIGYLIIGLVEKHRKEKQTEKRVFIIWIITVSIMTLGCIGYIGWNCGDQILLVARQLGKSIPEADLLKFYLPIIIAVLPLIPFNRWLQKKMKDLWN